MMLTIRRMTLDDLELGLALKAQAGWNQIEADWRRMLDLEPTGCFVAERDGRGIGTVVTCRFGPVAWIAMMLVEQAHRGQGIGRALMGRAIQHLDDSGVESIRLDATPLGRPLYESLGFNADATFLRYAGRVETPELTQPTQVGLSRTEVIAASEQESITQLVGRLTAIDQSATGTPRSRLLERLSSDNPDQLRVAQLHGRIVGYSLARPGAHAWHVGPCVAGGPEGEELLSDALRQHRGEAVIVDIPASHARSRIVAESHGLTVSRELFRMTRGRRATEELLKIWASSGPELG